MVHAAHPHLELDVVRVGNLPLATSQKELQELFAQYGEIHLVSLVNEEDANHPECCCGWVYMRQAGVAIDALDQAEFNGCRLKVQLMGTLIPLEKPLAA